MSGHGEAGPEAVTLASRIVAEALANADAHAHAQQRPRSPTPPPTTRLDVSITDDGRGFDPPAPPASRTATSA